MAVRSAFIHLLFQHLQCFDFMLLDGEIGLNRFLKKGDRLTFLLRRPDLPAILQRINASSQIKMEVLNKGYRSSQLHLLYDQMTVHLELLHKITHDSLILLDEEVLFRDKRSKSEAVSLPSVEHLFEWTILKNYLKESGLADIEYNYFRDFHILFKEDLLDVFNQKYGTRFQNMADLSHFEARARKQMLRVIRQLPENQLIHVIHLRWNEWMGAIRQAKLF